MAMVVADSKRLIGVDVAKQNWSFGTMNQQNS